MDTDPHPAYHFAAVADPDPAYHFDADPDPEPTFHFDADPDADPDPSFLTIKTLKKVKMGSYSIRVRRYGTSAN